jgi:hypothetical protein
MCIRIRSRAAGVGLVLCLISASCDKGSAGRSGPTGPSTAPGPAGGATVVGVDVSAPPTIAPGESVQLSATAIKSDGTRENVTAQMQWSSSNVKVLEVSATGLARGVANGEALLFNRYQGQHGSFRMIVLPTGTFQLIGRVTESGFGLENVTVTVIAGPGSGLTTVTSSTGAYALYGVGGTARIQIRKEGYTDRIETLDIVEHHTLDLELTANRPRADLTGIYTLAIAAGTCRYRFAIPEAARNRSYTAVVAQDGPRLTVTLSDADFIVTRDRGNRFFGLVEPGGRVTFALGQLIDNDPYYAFGEQDVVERFSPSSAILVTGAVAANVTSWGISGGLTGPIAVTNGTTAPFTSIAASCWGLDPHSFEMRRR